MDGQFIEVCRRVGIPNRGGATRWDCLLEVEGSVYVLDSGWVACGFWTSQELAMAWTIFS